MDLVLDLRLESGFDSFESKFVFDFGLKYNDNAGCFGSLDNFLFLCGGSEIACSLEAIDSLPYGGGSPRHGNFLLF